MSQTKLDQLEALSKAATPGPWEVDYGDCYAPMRSYSRGEVEHIADFDEDNTRSERSMANAALVEEMRNNIDDLIAVARAAQKLKCRENNKYHCHEVGFTELEEALEKLK